ncbi:uncharacterized protein EV154DRAFT_493009 [Mucor mucedo]|uniref:uncharacterized protein n=1 Tax=Mucor mucedo TaxID=29922 RepID=UPI0022208402|nr:uncharacterized protein EV154DRAFT_493009 [Mucor mucedo]KAI7896319.1 hypothetical protein EV154DRAFT_493009 [Mucor mucedo]
MTVMEAEDLNSTGTPPSSGSFTAPLTEEDDEDDSDDLVEEPVVRAPPRTPTPMMPATGGRDRRSTLGEMDMFYFQQQQQQMAYNMQIQQAMQMQQAQQYAQIQQYQAMQQYQSMSAADNNTRKNNNRKSVSAMDLMIQLEQEKAASRKTYKKKVPDPSKANLADGLLGKVPDPGQYNYNFQQQLHQQQMKANRKQMSRASKSDYNIQQQQRSSRPPSTIMMYDNNSSSRMMRSPMSRSESSPIPQISMSTPLQNPQYLIPPQMMMQQQQQQQQQQQLMMPPNMSTSRSSQYISKSNNRLSTFSGYNF